MKPNILVLGGSYFIGKAITTRLVEDGFAVTVLNRGTRAMEQVNQICCDRDDKDALVQALSGKSFDFVVDVSGLNRKQLENVCAALKPSTLKRYVFISSSAVYDLDHLTCPFRESDPVATNHYWTDYGTNKIEAEQFLTTWSADSGFDSVILRPPYVYGANNYAQRESFIFDHIVKNQPVILPTSNPKLQFISAADLAQIVSSLLEKKVLSQNVYNVGNRNAVTAEEWVNACAAAAGLPVTILKYDYQKDGRSVRDFFPFPDYSNVLDVTKIKEIYAYETDFIQGLKVAYQWYLEQKESLIFKEIVSQNEKEILKNCFSH